jgi:SAM-dependent methyltransferase
VNRQSGAARIFLYNWPIYVATWSLSAALLLWAARMPIPVALFASLLALGALAWSFASLAISFYIYDRSVLSGGAWVGPLLLSVGEPPSTWAAVHAGLDAEVELDATMAGRCVGRLDIFDPGIMTAPSIRRARIRTPPAHTSSACAPTSLALADDACDAMVVAFTAHEIRDRGARERFFAEVRRCLRPGGRMLLVEHVRDLSNFAAFGPGFMHFLPRREWLRLADHADLRVALERRITPWVMALVLEKSP